MKSILPIVGIGFIWSTALIIFVVIIMWLIMFSRMASKSWTAWRAHPTTNSEEERGYVLRLEFAKLVLIVLFLLSLVVFIPIMGIHNGKVLNSYEVDREIKIVGKCTISPDTWIWNRIDEPKFVGWMNHSEWQPFAILALVCFELILLQLLTSQSNHSKRIFTWQVKVTAVFAIFEFLAVLLLNCFVETMFVGHSLFVILVQIHLFIVEFCLIKIYCLMKKQIADLSYLKSREYYTSLNYKTHYKVFLIPMVILLQIMVAMEMVFVVSIIVETMKLNLCWVNQTFSFIKYAYSENTDIAANKLYIHWIWAVNITRQSLGMFVVWFLLVAQCVHSYKERKEEKLMRRNPNDCVMQDSDDIVAPLMDNGNRVINK